MAQQLTFTCSHCGFSVATWDDGNPYIEGSNGKRHHFYHPCEDTQIARIVEELLGHPPTQSEIEEVLRLHAGNESDFICQDCSKISRRDPDKDNLLCPSCKSMSIVDTWHLGGRPCPSCKQGRFEEGQPTAIS